MLEIYEMPGHLVRRLNQLSVSLFMEEMSKAGFDLTPVQYAALSAIGAYPALDQATLSSTIAYDRVTIGGVVDRLVQKGLVRRETSARDRRARELFLTQDGEETLGAVTPLVRHTQVLLLDGLDQVERETLIALLKKAASAADARNGASPQAAAGSEP